MEIRTDAGPSSAVQCVLSGGPYTTVVAGSAVPGGVSAAAVTEAGDVADEDLVRAEGVPVGASAGCFGHPLAFGRPDEIALHFRQSSRGHRLIVGR